MSDDLQVYMRDVNAKLDQIMSRLDMLTRLEERHIAQQARIDSLERSLDEVEDRVTDLEKTETRRSGKLEISGRLAFAIWGLIAAVLTGLFVKHN